MIFYNILRLCKKNGITISGLEKACGMGNGTIKKWKQGDPSVGRLQKVAEYFGITINDLIVQHDASDKTDFDQEVRKDVSEYRGGDKKERF